jgi:hypothetical protein
MSDQDSKKSMHKSAPPRVMTDVTLPRAYVLASEVLFLNVSLLC